LFEKTRRTRKAPGSLTVFYFISRFFAFFAAHKTSAVNNFYYLQRFALQLAILHRNISFPLRPLRLCAFCVNSDVSKK